MFEQNKEHQRIKERKDNEMMHRVNHDVMLRANYQSDNVVLAKRRQRERADREHERSLVETEECALRDRRETNRLVQEQEELADKLQNLRMEQKSHEARIRRVCDESEELKQLEQKLKRRALKVSRKQPRTKDDELHTCPILA
eukprot:615726_1